MKPKYHPEIDGLSAIAAVVILYYAQNIIFGYKPFKSEFIGVDIFLSSLVIQYHILF